MLKSLLFKLRGVTGWVPTRGSSPYPIHPKPDGASYQVYTKEFDEIIDGATFLARAHAAANETAAGINQYVNVDMVALADFSRKLSAGCQALRLNLQLLPKTARDDTIVALLFDHSGSLRGMRALAVTELAETLASAITDAGIATDVLGFTTVRWRGGRSREKWIADGRPKYPGRLNDLLHIVHLDGSGGPLVGPHRFPAMREERMLKENIDGEALEWAHRRLLENSRSRKVLIVFSDGAPVDDSTLNDNWQTILSDHAWEVAHRIAQSRELTLGAVGIEYAVDSYYPKSVAAKTLSALADVAPQFVSELIVSTNSPPPGRKQPRAG